jgi:DNA-binding transcriptional LysR family regulator
MDPSWKYDVARILGVAVTEEDEELPVLFLGSLGRVFVDAAEQLVPGERQRVLGILEQVLASGTDSDRNAVATGFWEAVLNRWDVGFDLEAVWPEMGPRSRDYCLAWNEFTGVPSPAWMTGDQS